METVQTIDFGKQTRGLKPGGVYIDPESGVILTVAHFTTDPAKGAKLTKGGEGKEMIAAGGAVQADYGGRRLRVTYGAYLELSKAEREALRAAGAYKRPGTDKGAKGAKELAPLPGLAALTKRLDATKAPDDDFESD